MKQHKEFLYPLVYIFSCGTYILRRVVISVVLEEISVHLEEFINHPLGDRRHDHIMSINIYPPLRHLQKKSFKNLIKIQLRMANFQPDQIKLGVGYHLSLHEVVDIAHIVKLAHKFSKILGLRITRKHGILNHGQGTVVEVKEFSSLGSSVLKLDNTATASLVRPEINVIGPGKMCKALNPCIYPLFFGSSVQKRTHKKQRKKAI
jgi:hypothetical protein